VLGVSLGTSPMDGTGVASEDPVSLRTCAPQRAGANRTPAGVSFHATFRKMPSNPYGVRWHVFSIRRNQPPGGGVHGVARQVPRPPRRSLDPEHVGLLDPAPRRRAARHHTEEKSPWTEAHGRHWVEPSGMNHFVRGEVDVLCSLTTSLMRRIVSFESGFGGGGAPGRAALASGWVAGSAFP
jgi:hypothetical protein